MFRSARLHLHHKSVDSVDSVRVFGSFMEFGKRSATATWVWSHVDATLYKSIWRSLDIPVYGCFQKLGYPQIIRFNRVFHYKPSIWGYPYFRKHPYSPRSFLHPARRSEKGQRMRKLWRRFVGFFKGGDGHEMLWLARWQIVEATKRCGWFFTSTPISNSQNSNLFFP